MTEESRMKFKEWEEAMLRNRPPVAQIYAYCTHSAWLAWQARQPEIDTLGEKLEIAIAALMHPPIRINKGE